MAGSTATGISRPRFSWRLLQVRDRGPGEDARRPEQPAGRSQRVGRSLSVTIAPCQRTGSEFPVISDTSGVTGEDSRLIVFQVAAPDRSLTVRKVRTTTSDFP